MLKHAGKILHLQTGPGGFSVVWKAKPASSVNETLPLLSVLVTVGLKTSNRNCPPNTPGHVNVVHGGHPEPVWSPVTTVLPSQ